MTCEWLGERLEHVWRRIFCLAMRLWFVLVICRREYLDRTLEQIGKRGRALAAMLGIDWCGA